MSGRIRRETCAILAVCGVDREAAAIREAVEATVLSGGRPHALARMLAEFGAARPFAGVVSIGVCGALDPALKAGDLVCARAVYDSVTAYPASPTWTERLLAATGAWPVELVFGFDQVATLPSTKADLFAVTTAATVDMESHVVARWAASLGLPMAVLRVVSDDANHGLPASAVAGMREDGGVDVPAVLAALLHRPADLPALIRTGRDVGRALAVLRTAARKAGPGLACPDAHAP